MAAALPEKLVAALDEPQFWHLATMNPDGSPHVTPVWAKEAGGRIVVNSPVGSLKVRNLEREPRLALSWVDPTNAYHSASIRGRVVDSYAGPEAEADIDSLAEKYLGQTPYPWRRPGERRITFVIEPTHVYHLDPG